MSESDQITPPVEPEAAPVTITEDSVTVAEEEVVKEEEKVEEKAELAPPESSKDEEEKIEEKEEIPPKEGEEVTPSEAPTDAEAPTETPSFKEESYNVADLKEQEKKALEAFRLQIEEAIKNKSILKKEKKKEAPVVAAAIKVEEQVKTDANTESVPPTSEVEVAPASNEEEKIAVPEEESKEEPEIPVEKSSEEATTGVSEDVETTVREVVEESSAVDPPPPPQNFFLWDIPVNKGDERTDVILLKFLRARDFKVKETLDMIRSTISWRRDFLADELVSEDLGTEFDSLAYMHGHDKEGHPVCYNNYSAFQDKGVYQQTLEDEKKFNRFLRWRIQLLEKGIRELDLSPGGVNFMVQVIDLKDSPGLMKRRQITKKAITLLQDNYPELVSKQIVLNIPWYFPALYAMFRRLFTPRQEGKILLSRPGKSTETLFKYISPDQVPIKYGGLSRPGDKEFEGTDAPVTQTIIKPGEKRTIDLPIDEGGSTLVWDISVVGWDVVYGEEFIPSDEKGYTVIVQKTKKLPASTEPIRNAFKAGQPGKLVLSVDNTASKKKKIIVYRSIIKQTIPITEM